MSAIFLDIREPLGDAEMTKANYRIALFGVGGAKLPEEVESELARIAAEFDLKFGDEIELVDGTKVSNAPIATVALFIGGTPVPTFASAWVLRAGIPLIPLVSELKNFSSEVPIELRHLNGMPIIGKGAATAIATAVMESLRLLPQQRRVFLSYVRTEATVAALQIFSDLEARQFRAFVDTHGVRPGAKFQEELWHQLCDCDVMVMLDTQGYFGRQWTREEFGKANLKKAAILRVAFPGVSPDPNLSISDTVSLVASDLDADGRLSPDALDRVGDKIEGLRSRSVAVRNASILGNLRIAVMGIGGKFLSPGALRRVEIELPRGKRIYAYPAVGVPSATVLNEIADHAESKPAAIVYDRLGIREEWVKHLRWLGDHVPEVRWIQALDAAWDLTSWDAEP
jgi:hypothetical protein